MHSISYNFFHSKVAIHFLYAEALIEKVGEPSASM